VSAWIVLPTYDEAENLEPLVRGIRAAVPDARVLVVDDGSPDGTGAVADALDGVDVLHRPAKSGLGRAYVAGFAHALAAGATHVVQMDADRSHDPRALPRLMSPTEIDLVIGSRYVPGGAIEAWGPVRRLVSRAGCAYARLVLGTGIRDLTGGFKCWRAEALEAIDYASVRSQGYAFQVEMTYRAIRSGLRVEEVPITFRERARGRSKMTPWIGVEAAWRLPLLRLAADDHASEDRRAGTRPRLG
jgi:dolichol-phosphate mannosyltransferase